MLVGVHSQRECEASSCSCEWCELIELGGETSTKVWSHVALIPQLADLHQRKFASAISFFFLHRAARTKPTSKHAELPTSRHISDISIYPFAVLYR